MIRFSSRPILTLAAAAIAVTALSPAPARAEFNAEQKTEIEAMMREYILRNGDVLIESVNNFQQKQEEEANRGAEVKAKELLASLKTDKNIAVAGNPKGDVTVVEFFDYNCGYCKKALEEVLQLLKDDKNVKIVLYDMPILGPDSLEASRWALAAKKQNKYFEYHVALMEYQGAKDEGVYKDLAKKVGLDADKLAKDKNDSAIEAEIEQHLAVAQSLGIQGTPGFLVNEQIFRGYIPYDALKGAVDTARTKGKAE